MEVFCSADEMASVSFLRKIAKISGGERFAHLNWAVWTDTGLSVREVEVTGGVKLGRSPDSIPRIVISAEYALFRDGLRTALEHGQQFVVIDEVGDAPDVVRVTNKLKPDVLVIDLRTLGPHWVQVLRELAAAKLPTAVVVLSTASECPDIVRIVDLGVSALVLKDSNAAVLRRAVSAALAGACWIDHERVVNSPGDSPPKQADVDASAAQRRFRLTPREIDIVCAVGLAFSNRDIAEKLAISETTVKHHLTNIFNKTGMSTRLELAMFALHHHIERATA